MSKLTLPCIACGRELYQVEDDASENQPYLATEFKTYGHYGSTAYDMEMGHYLVVNICDLCLCLHRNRVLEGRDKKPIMVDGAIEGWEDCNWKPVPWSISRISLEHTIEEALRDFDILQADNDENRIEVKITGAQDIPERHS